MFMSNLNQLLNLCKLIRYNILTSTSAAGSGHPTSSLSATELMATLFFGGFLHYDLDNPHNLYNDRIIFSKGHASPLLYSLYQAAGVLTHEELLDLRKFDSVLEGHPTPRFKYIDVSTGSLGQGLSAGVGMAMGIKLRSRQTDGDDTLREPHVFVLLGDSEMAEGQVWEAMEIASFYKLNNVVAVLDVNRLGQRGETMLGWDLKTYEKRASSFGWNTVVIDGHDLKEVSIAFEKASQSSDKPTMIIAKTLKGKGVSLLEDLDNWHGKALPKDKLEVALKELGSFDKNLTGKVAKPSKTYSLRTKDKKTYPQSTSNVISYTLHDLVATREAYGDALVMLGENHDDVIVLDAETSNSTFAEKFKKPFPDRFLEMFIAEQNMVTTALGLSKMGYVPFVSSFAAFLARAFDQIRMSQYSDGNLKIVGSHAGVSIGTDGSSQMALEDLAMMRSVLNSVVFYPSDAMSTLKLTQLMYHHQGISYMRLTREKTPVLYKEDDNFEIGGSKVLHVSSHDKAVVIAAGITLHEALKAHAELAKKGTAIAVIDAYSVKPIDTQTILRYAKKTGHVIVVEDHYPYGGLGEAVKEALSGEAVKITHLAVHKIPRSATPEELLRFEEIDAEAILRIL